MAIEKNTDMCVEVVGDGNTVHNHYNPGTRRRATLKKKTRKTTGLKQAPPKDRRKKPGDLDTSEVCHLSPRCRATDYISAEWSHEPMMRMTLHTHETENGPTKYRCHVVFNDECHRKFGLNYGHKLAMYTDPLLKPKYLVIQNVVREFACPAHVHKLGTYEIWGKPKPKPSVRPTGRPTFLGTIGPSDYSLQPMALFERLDWITDHTLRLYQDEDNPNQLLGILADVQAVPKTSRGKTFRIGHLVEDDFYYRDINEFRMPLPDFTCV